MLRLAPATERLLAQFETFSPHATLLTGQVGVGLYTIAHEIATKNGTLLASILPESKTSSAIAAISVERIRQLYVETRSRMQGPHFVIIDEADSMNHAAQNALLKLLEEPNESIFFILTSHRPDALLPTIRSRVQIHAVPPIDMLHSRRLLKALGVTDTQTEQRLLYVAQGLPAELTRLVRNESDFKALLERVQIARQFVEGNVYQRLAVIQASNNDRTGTLKTIEMILLLLRRSLAARPDQTTVRLIERLVEASAAVRANGNIKIQLSAAVV